MQAFQISELIDIEHIFSTAAIIVDQKRIHKGAVGAIALATKYRQTAPKPAGGGLPVFDGTEFCRNLEKPWPLDVAVKTSSCSSVSLEIMFTLFAVILFVFIRCVNLNHFLGAGQREVLLFNIHRDFVENASAFLLAYNMWF